MENNNTEPRDKVDALTLQSKERILYNNGIDIMTLNDEFNCALLKSIDEYGRLKWNQACEEQKRYIAEWIRPHESDALCDEIYKTPKPEFKP